MVLQLLHNLLDKLFLLPSPIKANLDQMQFMLYFLLVRVEAFSIGQFFAIAVLGPLEHFEDFFVVFL